MVDPMDLAIQLSLPFLFDQASALYHPAEGSCLRVLLPLLDTRDPATHIRHSPLLSNHHYTYLRSGQQAAELPFPRFAVFFQAELVRYSVLDFLLMPSDLHA